MMASGDNGSRWRRASSPGASIAAARRHQMIHRAANSSMDANQQRHYLHQELHHHANHHHHHQHQPQVSAALTPRRHAEQQIENFSAKQQHQPHTNGYHATAPANHRPDHHEPPVSENFPALKLAQLREQSRPAAADSGQYHAIGRKQATISAPTAAANQQAATSNLAQTGGRFLLIDQAGSRRRQQVVAESAHQSRRPRRHHHSQTHLLNVINSDLALHRTSGSTHYRSSGDCDNNDHITTGGSIGQLGDELVTCKLNNLKLSDSFDATSAEKRKRFLLIEKRQRLARAPSGQRMLVVQPATSEQQPQQPQQQQQHATLQSSAGSMADELGPANGAQTGAEQLEAPVGLHQQRQPRDTEQAGASSGSDSSSSSLTEESRQHHKQQQQQQQQQQPQQQLYRYSPSSYYDNGTFENQTTRAQNHLHAEPQHPHEQHPDDHHHQLAFRHLSSPLVDHHQVVPFVGDPHACLTGHHHQFDLRTTYHYPAGQAHLAVHQQQHPQQFAPAATSIHQLVHYEHQHPTNPTTPLQAYFLTTSKQTTHGQAHNIDDAPYQLNASLHHQAQSQQLSKDYQQSFESSAGRLVGSQDLYLNALDQQEHLGDDEPASELAGLAAQVGPHLRGHQRQSEPHNDKLDDESFMQSRADAPMQHLVEVEDSLKFDSVLLVDLDAQRLNKTDRPHGSDVATRRGDNGHDDSTKRASGSLDNSAEGVSETLVYSTLTNASSAASASCAGLRRQDDTGGASLPESVIRANEQLAGSMNHGQQNGRPDNGNNADLLNGGAKFGASAAGTNYTQSHQMEADGSHYHDRGQLGRRRQASQQLLEPDHSSASLASLSSSCGPLQHHNQHANGAHGLAPARHRTQPFEQQQHGSAACTTNLTTGPDLVNHQQLGSSSFSCSSVGQLEHRQQQQQHHHHHHQLQHHNEQHQHQQCFSESMQSQICHKSCDQTDGHDHYSGSFQLMQHQQRQQLDGHHHLSDSNFEHSSASCTNYETATVTSSNEEPELKLCEWENCGHTFLDMQEFVRHIEEKHVNLEPREKNRYFCLWANCKRNEQEFNARYKLLIHMRVHSGEKPYPCNAANCKKSFSRLENLKIHVRSHTGEKPYKCNYNTCSKSFTNSSDRIKHHKTHQNPKPYTCSRDGCTKRYTDPSSLRKHLRAHRRQMPPAQALHPAHHQAGHGPPVLMVHHQPMAAEIEGALDPGGGYMGQQPVCCLPAADYDPSIVLEQIDEQQRQQQMDQFAVPKSQVDSEQQHHHHHQQHIELEWPMEDQQQQPAPAAPRWRQGGDQPWAQWQVPAGQGGHQAPLAASHQQFSRSWCAGSSSLTNPSRLQTPNVQWGPQTAADTEPGATQQPAPVSGQQQQAPGGAQWHSAGPRWSVHMEPLDWPTSETGATTSPGRPDAPLRHEQLMRSMPASNRLLGPGSGAGPAPGWRR